jgi:anaerobic magnesium-protoporphyrin IX monomethyl ester cyclase
MTIMRIALVRPYADNLAISPHLGLGYISSYLKSKGHTTKLFDPQRDQSTDTQKTVEEITEWKPDFVGITATTAMYMEAERIAGKLKGKFPIVMGGVHPSVLPKETMEYGSADYVVVGDGEYAFEAIANGEYKSGSIVQGSPVKDLDAMPWPDWEEIGLLKYPRAPWGGVTKRWPVGTIITTRGCPYSCTFCAAPMYTQRKMRYRNPIDVVDEIDYLMCTYGIKELNISDDNFTVKREHAVAVCEEILRRNIKLTWSCENGIRADRVDPELLKLMKRAGCYRVAIGIESPNEEILKRAKKLETLEQIEKAVYDANKAGLEVRGCFVVGLPGETKETMQKTARWARSMPLLEANFTLLDVLPGSELWTELKGQFKPDWSKKSFKTPEYLPHGLLKEDLIEGQKLMFRMFYTTPRRAWRIITRLRPAQFKQFLRRLKDFRIFELKVV